MVRTILVRTILVRTILPGWDIPGQDNPDQDNPSCQDNLGQDNPGRAWLGQSWSGLSGSGQSWSWTILPGWDNPGRDNPGQDNPDQDNPMYGRRWRCTPHLSQPGPFYFNRVSAAYCPPIHPSAISSPESFRSSWRRASAQPRPAARNPANLARSRVYTPQGQDPGDGQKPATDNRRQPPPTT